MRSKIVIICFLTLLFSLVGCGRITRDYVLTQARGWLNQQKGPTTNNIEGEWVGITTGWRGGIYIQDGNRITGNMEMYSIEGVLNGDSVYLIALSEGYVSYTIIMHLRDRNTLVGKYSGKLVDNEDEMTDSFIMKRVPK